MNQTPTSADMAQNPLLYAEIQRAAKNLWRLYSDGVELVFDWQDLMHEVLMGLDFDCSKIALFSYRFKKCLTKEKVSLYVYYKYLKEYKYYADATMPDQEFPDFPVGETIETCIKFLVKKLGRPLSCSEVVYYLRKEDYTRYYMKCDGIVSAALRKINPEFVKRNERKSQSGLQNHNAKMTEERQTEAKRLFAIWGKKYKAIGKEIGVSKDTVRTFIMGDSYVAYAV